LLVVVAFALRPRSIRLAFPLLRLALATAFSVKIHKYPASLMPVVLNTNCSTLSADETVSLQCMSGVLYKRQGEIREGISSEILTQ
jgi:hypothetical protein